MKLNKKGLDLIKRFETFKSRPYICPTGHPSIGYGTTYYPNGVKVRLSDKPITEPVAMTYLMDHLEKHVFPGLNEALKVKLSENRYSALCAFIHNVGIGRWPSGKVSGKGFKGSTLLKVINLAPGAPGIRTEFMKWNKGTINGKKQVIDGLTNRRKAEADLYFDIN